MMKTGRAVPAVSGHPMVRETHRYEKLFEDSQQILLPGGFIRFF